MTDNKYTGNSIEILEGLEPVRKRPGMYIGSVSSKGLNHLVFEIVDNAVDEHLAGYCSEINVILEADGSCTVSDNGRGIPVGINEKTGRPAVEVVFTVLHAGGKFSEGNYKISGGLHGVGASVVNALSAWLEVDVKSEGKVYNQRYERGQVMYDLKVKGSCPRSDTGSRIRFLPDGEIFDKIYFRADSIKRRLHETAYLNPDLTIIFENRRFSEEEKVVFHEPEGILSFINELTRTKEPVAEAVYFRGRFEKIEVEGAFQFTDEFQENILGFCNNIYTQEGGTHLTGFKSRFTTLINQYARELGILKEKDDNFTGADVRCGMTAVIAIKHPDPRFEGQTKTRLDNPDAQRAVSDITGSELERYYDKNLENLKATIGCAQKSAKIRRAEEKTRTNMLSKSKFVMEGNGKLSNCESRNPAECEIFIVEGDSAGGSAKKARNRKTQAILPLRGKILNVEKAAMDKVLSNAEIKTMILAFGCGFSEGYGNDFDISKLRYDKIIIMTDADVDGAHISTLLLTFFYRFMPELITSGHVYLATPPLYKAVPKKGKEEYLYDDAALEKYRKTHRGSFTLQRYKGLGEMDAEQLWETTLDPERRILKKVEIEDAADANRVTEMLMGSEVAPRKQFIHDNAVHAQLDI